MNDPRLDFAFLKLNDGLFALGRGPFVGQADPPEGESAFYLNDFTLTDSRPWKVPRALEIVSDPGLLLRRPVGEATAEVVWEPLEKEKFGCVFREIQEAFQNGSSLQKVVPAVTERGYLRRGSPVAWLESMLEGLSPKLWPYGFSMGNRGVIGATPERFLHVKEGEINTMALAGTARPGQDHAFESDSKQICEHEFVVRHLVDSLSDLGELQQAPRRILHLEGIVHFLTSVAVKVAGPLDLNRLLRRVHPTPAVGVFPASEDHLRRLDDWRLRLRTPTEFGAPFGLWHEGVFHSVVSIRHIAWLGRQLFIPSGCGIIAASDFEQEWQELALKRHVVKEMIGPKGGARKNQSECDEPLKPSCR